MMLSVRIIERLSKSMFDGCILKEEIKENCIFVSYRLTYVGSYYSSWSIKIENALLTIQIQIFY